MSRKSWLCVAGLVLAALCASCDDDETTGPADSDSLFDPAIAPRVIATYPPDGGSGPFNIFVEHYESRPHFSVHLNKFVERPRFGLPWLLVEGFSEPVRCDLIDRSYAGEYLTDVLSVQVRSAATYRPLYYEIGKSYAVTVDTTLRDFTGRQPAAPYRFTFVPEPHFRVVSAEYASQELGRPLSPQEPVLVFFNAPPRVDVGNSIQFTPAAPGQWDRIGNLSRVVFRHSQPFAFGTTYTLRVESTASDSVGHALPEPFVTSFQVEGFEIKDTEPRDGQVAVEPYWRLGIRTTGVIDTTTVPSALTLVPAASGSFSYWTTGFDFAPDQDFLAETQYTVTISTALHAWDGTALAAPYSFSFTTAPFQVLGSQPWDGSVSYGRVDSILVQFNSHLDPTTMTGVFIISPDAPGTLAVGNEGTALVFSPSAPLATSTLYQVTISTSLHSQRGATLHEPYVFSFTTANE